MKWLMSLMMLVSFQLKAEVSPDQVDTMIDQMVTNNVISKVDADKAKVRLRTMSSDQWAQINTKAEAI
jgi:hypothetical protein